ncbi:MAG: nucleoside recognition protein [Gammaproteobacteria bacterium]|nr:nucleoside recognition protein [Gammaproteobacteria bacterium]
MLNKIWAGLIIISIVYAASLDITDEWTNHYDNGHIYSLDYTASSQPGFIQLDYLNTTIKAQLHSRANHSFILIATDQPLPDPWLKVAHHQPGSNKEQIQAEVITIQPQTHQLQLRLPEIHWVKIRAITQAAFDTAEFAVKLALGLAGIMALWLGLMQIAEKSGLVFSFVKLIRPLLHKLFPEIPRDHPALGSIGLNLAANVLGLGNAATPLGIKAMQHLQQLNTHKDRASNSMCMFLALNTSSVQLLPPVTLIALMGTQVSELILPIILATCCSTLAAVIAVKLYTRAGKL